MDTTRLKLFRILIGKSIAETLFVATLAVGFFFSAFPPYFHGFGEATPDSIAGWAVNNRAPWERVEVQLFIDGKLAGTQVAQLSRPDVATAGWARDEWHGYNFVLTGVQAGNHEARVYALHRTGNRITLQLLGDPIPFLWPHK